MLLFVLTTVVSTTAFASNDNDGKNEGTKVELSSSVTIQSAQEVPDFNLNVDVLKLSVLPACQGDQVYPTNQYTGYPPGYVQTNQQNFSWGYTVTMEKPCTEVISCPFCPPPGFITFESTDVITQSFTVIPQE